MSDLRYALRSLAKSPVFTSVAVLSLALGIGANTAIFSLVNAILLSSLPVPNPQELRVLQWTGLDVHTAYFTGSMERGGNRSNYGSGSINATGGEPMTADSFTHPQFRALREQGAALADIFGYANLNNITARARQEAFTAEGLMVTDNYFSALGVRPALGRLFGPEEAGAGAAPVAVISHEWWEKEFALDPGVIGATVALNGNSFTVVGVLPREFRGVNLGDRTGFYVPISAQPQLMPSWPTASPSHWWVKIIARMKPGASDAQLLAVLDRAFAGEASSAMKEPGVVLRDGRAGPAWDRKYYRRPLRLLLGVVGVVILVACANLAGLSLARGAAREHEFAVRAALGSGRWRLARQSLAESLVLASTGAGLGLLLAFWGKSALGALLAGSPDGLRYDLALDFRVLAATLGLAVLAAILSGLLPAWRAGHVDPLAGLKSAAALGAPRLRAGRILVSAQIALSVLLLAGAGLYVRTLVNLVRINPGFATDHLLLFQVTPRGAGYRGPQLAAFYERVLDSLAKIPAVRSVALTQFRLLGHTMSGGSFFTLPSHPELFRGEKKPQAHQLTVSEAFFPTLGIPVLHGRGFTVADTANSLKVVVVNETFVHDYFAQDNPIGQILRVDKTDWQIVGVCRDAKYTELKLPAPPTVYFSFRQSSVGLANFALRTSLPPLAVATAARKAVAAVDPNVPIATIVTQEQVRDQGISQERMFATLVGSLAVLAVLLACIGLYGLMAYNVTRRTGEIGVRMALGARPQDVARSVVREALRLAGAGVIVGVPAALGLAQLIKSQLYGVPAHDPLTFAFGALVLLGVAAAAAWLPARRAARVDPMVALRAE
ncbi:MAG TPA: ABC transporter permease [Opitutaceae bacterium]|nr:ABC transporter permease [Opitutaceae bacterium]